MATASPTASLWLVVSPTSVQIVITTVHIPIDDDKTVFTKKAVPADAVHVGTQNFLPGKASPVRVDIFLLYNS